MAVVFVSYHYFYCLSYYTFCMEDVSQVIAQTKSWIKSVVIGCNFCPFASREFNQNSIHYQVEVSGKVSDFRELVLKECKRLDSDRSIGTTLIIFPNAFPAFAAYLQFVKNSEQWLKQKKYEGIYQLASFHPLYQFENSALDDAANYTNRSVYPMLHLLREDQVRKALQYYPDAAGIPDRNIRFAREKGALYFQLLRDGCQ